MTDEEIDDILGNVKNELRQMNNSEQRIVTRSRESFGQWARDAIVGLARGLGYIISVPIRAIGEVVSSLWKWLFG